MNNEMIAISTECKSCITIDKSLKSEFLGKQSHPHKHCAKSNQENHTVFGGTIYDKKVKKYTF